MPFPIKMQLIVEIVCDFFDIVLWHIRTHASLWLLVLLNSYLDGIWCCHIQSILYRSFNVYNKCINVWMMYRCHILCCIVSFFFCLTLPKLSFVNMNCYMNKQYSTTFGVLIPFVFVILHSNWPLPLVRLIFFIYYGNATHFDNVNNLESHSSSCSSSWLICFHLHNHFFFCFSIAVLPCVCVYLLHICGGGILCVTVNQLFHLLI